MAVLLAGCHATYAPPIRAFQYGAPARLERGRLELGGTAGGVEAPNVGGPHLAVGIRDWVAIEAGGNLQLMGRGNDKWAMGFFGPRFSWAPRRHAPVHFIGDLELGLGAGVGGVLDDNRDGKSSLDRVAWGGYQGLGAGLQIDFFSIFARVRIEESKATEIPTTLWGFTSLGIEFNVLKRFALGAAGGYMGYTNERDRIDGWFYQVSATVFFDAGEE